MQGKVDTEKSEVLSRAMRRTFRLACSSGPFHYGAVSLWIGIELVLSGLIWAQESNLLAPEDLLVLWTFDDSTGGDRSIDLVRGTVMEFEGAAKFATAGAGRSGAGGDRALDLGTTGSAASPSHGIVSDRTPSGAALMQVLNQANSADQLSVVFWQRWHTETVRDSSSVWFVSPSAGAGDRGFQAHVPWGNEVVYFDTSGCCAPGTQRLQGEIRNGLPDLMWSGWHHVALVKSGGAKQVWVNGELVLDQGSGADPLLTDWKEIVLGHSPTEPQRGMQGLIDDFAVFRVALNEGQVNALASGSLPSEIVTPYDQWPPQISGIFPGDGTPFHILDGGLQFTVSTVDPNSIDPVDIRLVLNGGDVSQDLVIEGSVTERVVSYGGDLEANLTYTARVEVSDNEGRASSVIWSFDTFELSAFQAETQIDLSALGIPKFSSENEGSSSAWLAIDDDTSTHGESADHPNGFWEVELSRVVRMNRIELVAPEDPELNDVVAGLTLRIFDLRDRVLYQETVPGVGPGETWTTKLEGGLDGRIIRFGLEGDRMNGYGDYRVSIAEVRVYGDPSTAYGPVSLDVIGIATQSNPGTAPGSASLAIDGDAETFSETADSVDGFWLLTLDRERPIQRVELINRADDFAARMEGLTLSILDSDSNVIISAPVPNPGAGATWGYEPPAGTRGRHLRIGLENNAVNGYGDRVVSLAEVNILTGKNFALDAEPFMMRFNDGLPPAANGNDGDYRTFTETTRRSVGAFWEVDLGEAKALYSVRIVSPEDFQSRMTHATVRLYDGDHRSVFSQHLGGTSKTFDVILPGATLARYARVGFENKERSDPPGTFWHLGLRELQAFGREATEVGILDFASLDSELNAGETTELHWRIEDLHELRLYPSGESMGAFVDEFGVGRLSVRPSESGEYLLVGSNSSGEFTRFTSITVDGHSMPVQISEFVARNRLSLRDGQKNSPDWIELHNPNNQPVDLSGHGLSDDPADPTKWVFPAGVSIPAHGFMLVLASGRNEAFDDDGYLHANFRLNGDGEFVILTAPDGGTVLDSVLLYPDQMEDLAYGRALNGDWAFLEPTPGSANLAPVYEGWLQPLEFSHQRGFHTEEFTLEITDPNNGAQIYYSLDGTEPSIPYVDPITVRDNRSVRALVRRANFKSPPIQTHTYLFLDRVIDSSEMRRSITQDARYTDRLKKGLNDLPSICISVPELPDDWEERPASVEILLNDGSPPVQVNAGVIRFGGAWTTFAKKNYRLKFRSEYGARKLEVPLFDGFDRGRLVADSFDEIDLRAGGHDMLARGFYMSSRFSEDTMLDMGSLNPHGRFVHVYFNGEYWGQYHARERLTDAFLADYLGGESEDYVNVRGNDNDGPNFVAGTPAPLHREPWEAMRASRFSYEAVKPLLDVRHFIDFMIMWNYGNAESEYRAAGPIEPGSGFKFWLGDADGFLRPSSDRTGNPGPAGLLSALAGERHPDFMTLLADRIYRHLFNEGALTPERNLERLNQRMEEIADSLIAECARWGYRAPANWEAAAQEVRDTLFPDQTNRLLARLRSRNLYPALDAPTLSQHGGTIDDGFRLSMGANSGTLYYTLDGADPRLPGGGVSSEALSVAVDESVKIPRGANWRFWDRGGLPAADWASRDFDDAGWSVGPAPLGYGDEGLATLLEFGPDASDKYRVYYFRQTFSSDDSSETGELTVELVRDDGVVVYLNGQELYRDNMPDGPVSPTTLASSVVGGSEETQIHRFTVPSSSLLPGANVLAAEVHQATPTSSDLRFDLSLQGSAPFEVSIESDTVVKARAFDGSNWSALVEATFVTSDPQAPSAGDLLISEVHYNPEGADDYEFLELYNRGTKRLDLSEVRLTGGVEFLFPSGFTLSSGGFVLIVENRTAFNQRYGSEGSPYGFSDLLVAGEWSGRLANEGEGIAVLDAQGFELVSLSYETGGAWPRRADGRGSSIELRNLDEALTVAGAGLNVYLARGAHWRSSGLYHGSPGRFDIEPRDVVINEVLAHSVEGLDWIELHNTGVDPVSLREHFLSNDYGSIFKYAFLDDMMIPANGFMVLNATELGFDVEEMGSDLVLAKALNGDLIRFVDSVNFPAVDQRVSFGRYVRSDGVGDFTELLAPTPMEVNAQPAVGPVVISEIMYHPVNLEPEYVELKNVGPTEVLLYDAAQAELVWELSGAIEFKFPSQQSMAVGETMVVCATDPVEFRSRYSVPASVTVLGPWSGTLNNAGERLNLRRPGLPRQDGVVPYYRVDSVRYEPVAPWPEEADGGGASLVRAPLVSYGNDSANWTFSPPGGTPGVEEGNRPPILQPIPDLRYPALIPLAVEINATDPDLLDQTLTYAAAGLPAGLEIDAVSGSIFGVVAEPGVYVVTVRVTDDQAPPLDDSREFILTVTSAFRVEPMLSETDGRLEFSFQALQGETYEIQYSNDLSRPDWQVLQRIDNVPADGLQMVADLIDPERPQGFVRVIWIQGGP